METNRENPLKFVTGAMADPRVFCLRARSMPAAAAQAGRLLRQQDLRHVRGASGDDCLRRVHGPA